MGSISEMLVRAMGCIKRGKVTIGQDFNPNSQAGFQEWEYYDLPLGPEMGNVFDENISPERQAYLDSVHGGLITKYDDQLTGRITHADVGHMLQDLAANPNLTDLEKAYVFTEIANNKSIDSTLGFGGTDGDYGVDNLGLRPEHEDSQAFRGQTTEAHTIVGFNDGYHGTLGNSENDHGIAEQMIREHEDGSGPNWVGNWFGDNPGDASASLATVNSFRAFRYGGFDAFADTWIDEMLVDNWEDIVEVDNPLPPTGTTTTTVPSTTIPVSPTTTTPTTIPEGPPTGTTTTTTLPED